MLLLLILYLFQNSSSKSALISQRDFISDQATTPSPTCLCPANGRSIWDILWSCLATIVACTWVSVHPNISSPNKSRFHVLFRRLELMFWAIIAPELMICWAMRQWSSARRLEKRYREMGWSKTHGYFLQMGGFMLFNKWGPNTVLSPRRFQALYEKGWIDFPTITEEEIQDRSKADAFSKMVVIGQTSWFIVQCVARRAQGLDITALELLTLALAALNGVMYFLWWNKPVDVGCYVPVYLLDKQKTFPIVEEYYEPETSSSISTIKLRLALLSVRRGILISIQFLFDKWASWHGHIQTIGFLEAFRSISITHPREFVVSVVMRMSSMMGGTVESYSVQDGQQEVHMFFSDDIFSWRLTSAGTLVGLVFGSIHCLGWFFTFPSRPETILWRISSAIVTGSAIAIWVQLVVARFVNNHLDTSQFLKKYYNTVLWPIFHLSDIVFGIVYIAARLFLLVEAFISLRYLVPGATASVDWLSFIPHI